jgi:hypothetical protein
MARCGRGRVSAHPTSSLFCSPQVKLTVPPEVVSAVVSRQVHGVEVEDYALATMRTPSGILIHNEVGYTMPTWPANQTDGEQKSPERGFYCVRFRAACRSSLRGAT